MIDQFSYLKQTQQGFMQTNCPTKRALDAGESARFTSIFLALGFSTSQALSTPAPARVTQTVGRLVDNSQS